MKNLKLPVAKLNEFTEVNNEDTIDCFYGFEEESKKADAVKMIESKMSDHSSFKIDHDFRINTKMGDREWSFIGNVMIYENRSASDWNRIIVGGKKNYECGLWMSAIKGRSIQIKYINIW